MSRALTEIVTETARQFSVGGQNVTFVPLTIKRRQNRKLLVAPEGTSLAVTNTSLDLPMIRTIGRAFYWQRLLDSGEAADANAIAKRFQLDHGWVCEILQLTRLAPDILAAIAEGRQPRHLNLQAIRRGVPVEWSAQRQVLGFIAA